MKTETIYRKVLVSERVPSESGEYDTDLKRLEYFEHLKAWRFDFKPTWWLEPIKIPSEEEIYNQSFQADITPRDFIKGANYILGFINNKK